MIVPAALAVLIVLVPLLGGKIRHLAEINLKRTWLAVSALLIQVVVLNILPRGLPTMAYVAIHLATYVLAAGFVVSNRRVPGLPVIALGAALNLVVIAANHGVMPASPAASRIAGHNAPADKFVNSAESANAHLAILGDNFAIPAGYPLANVFSIGDIVLIAGAALTFHVGGQSVLGRRRPNHYRTVHIEPIS